MTTVSRRDFVQSMGAAQLPVAGLASAERLKGVAVRRADENGDGVISGRAEAAALWDAMCARDVVETRQARRLLPLPLLPATSVPTLEGQRLAAVESFRMADVRAKQDMARGDRFAREGVLRTGPARGEPLDTTKARPVVILDEKQKIDACRKAGVDPATIEHAFANLSHDGMFHTALVPRGAVKELSVLVESFPAPVPAAHAMLRFTLADDKPAILVPQGSDPGARTLALPDLVFSAEALGQPGWKYDLVAGEQGAFALVNRFESLEDRYRHVNRFTPKHPVAMHRLQVTAAEANDVLREAIATSHRVGLDHSYRTLNRSCGTEAFAVLDRGIGDDVPAHVKVARAITGERLPPLADRYLAMRGLLASGHRPVDLDAAWAAAPRAVRPRAVRPHD
jgi:hypothetical protein